MPLVNITVLESGPETPVVGANTYYYTSPGAVLVGSAITDISGVASIVLPEGNYFVMVVPTWVYVSARNAITVTALGPNDWDILVEAIASPNSTNPDMCTVSGFVRDPTGRLVREKHLLSIYQAYDPAIVSDAAIYAEERHIATDAYGWVQFDVYRGTYYNVTLRPALTDETKASEQLTCYGPDAAYAKLVDFIFPVPTLVTFDPVSISLSVGGVDSASVEITWSNTNTTSDATVLEFLEDPLYSLRKTSDGITITGLSVGTQTCTVTGWIPGTPEQSRIPVATISGSIDVTVT